MFGQGSAWVPFVQRDTHDLAGLIHTPLVAVPAFRRELLRGLGDTSAAGGGGTRRKRQRERRHQPVLPR